MPAAVAEPKKRGVRRARSGSFPADPDPPPAPESGECHERLVRCYLPYNNTIRVLAGRFSGRLSETCQAASFFGTSALRALFPIMRFSKEGRSSVGRPVLSCAAFARDRPLVGQRDADAPYAGSREREAGVYGRGLSGMDGRRSWTVRGCRQASADETNGYKYVEYGSVSGNLLDVTESFFIFAAGSYEKSVIYWK